jgi:Spy/CpxP family protein refolding chaperone
MGMMGELGPALQRAQVTDEQQQQIKSIIDSHREEFRAIGERMKTVHQGMRAVIEADTIDENAIRAKVAEAAVVEADQVVLGARVRAEVMAILTPEQLQSVKAFRAEMEQRMKQGPPKRPPVQ